MSVTPELRSSARATYRLLFRTAANTFRGDDRVLHAFREKIRSEFREGRSITDSSAYTARIQHGREVADVLRKNVVQGVKVSQHGGGSGAGSGASVMASEAHQNDRGVWRLQLTKDTELGSNDTIKLTSNPSRSQGSGGGCCQSASASVSSSLEQKSTVLLSSKSGERVENELYNDSDNDDDNVSVDLHPRESESESSKKRTEIGCSLPPPPPVPKKTLYFSALKRLSQNRIMPTLNEDDLEESFVRGSGPGGQSINKTSNNVKLLHKPTGIRVTCQETRSLQTNRMIARKKLLERLDRIANPGLTKEDLRQAKEAERERRRKKKARKKARSRAKKGLLPEEEEDLALHSEGGWFDLQDKN